MSKQLCYHSYFTVLFFFLVSPAEKAELAALPAHDRLETGRSVLDDKIDPSLFFFPSLSYSVHQFMLEKKRERGKSQRFSDTFSLYSSHIFSDYASGQPGGKKKVRERTSIYSSPAGRYVSGPERCPPNIKMHLFTLPPLRPHQK